MLEKRYIVYKKDHKELPKEWQIQGNDHKLFNGVTLYEDDIGWYFKWGWMHPTID